MTRNLQEEFANILWLIPAKRHSSRCENKNWRPFLPNGGCLTELAKHDANSFSSLLGGLVFISIDIPNEHRPWGASCGTINGEEFDDSLRPAHLCQPDTTTAEVVLYEWERNGKPKWVVVLQPTNPLRTAGMVDNIKTAVLAGVAAYDAKQKYSIDAHPLPPTGNWYLYKMGDAKWRKKLDKARDSMCTMSEAIAEGNRICDIDTEADFKKAQELVEKYRPEIWR